MKKWLFLSFTSLLVLGFLFVGISLSAAPVENKLLSDTILNLDEESGEYSIESMLIYALKDEYLAKATYEKIIETYGDIKPFSKIVLAEQTHINLLLPLFETYAIELPAVPTADEITLPESISSALATGVEAEKENILLYETFLSQTNLPDDVRAVFESLQSASEKHLEAFSKDRLVGAGYDLAHQFQKMFGKGNGSSRGQFKSGIHNA